MGDFSTEFCGGTHVGATGEIGAFIITGESSVAAGIRRIEAQTGPGAVETIASERAVAHRLSRALTVPIERVAERVTAMQEEIKALKRAADRARSEELAGRAGDMPTVRIGDVSACVGWIEGADVEALRSTFDRLKSKHRNEKFLAVLGTGDNGKATLIVGATPDLAGTAFEAGKLIRAVAPLFDGKGGGKPQFAQAGGKDSEKLKAAIEAGRVLEALKSAGG
jgi:alanyl-tRNA synthetase